MPYKNEDPNGKYRDDQRKMLDDPNITDKAKDAIIQHERENRNKARDTWVPSATRESAAYSQQNSDRYRQKSDESLNKSPWEDAQERESAAAQREWQKEMLRRATGQGQNFATAMKGQRQAQANAQGRGDGSTISLDGQPDNLRPMTPEEKQYAQGVLQQQNQAESIARSQRGANRAQQMQAVGMAQNQANIQGQVGYNALMAQEQAQAAQQYAALAGHARGQTSQQYMGQNQLNQDMYKQMGQYALDQKQNSTGNMLSYDEMLANQEAQAYAIEQKRKQEEEQSEFNFERDVIGNIVGVGAKVLPWLL